MSAYIHNNTKYLQGYAKKEEEYRCSSYGIYTGYRKDFEGIVCKAFLLDLFAKDETNVRRKYIEIAQSMKEISNMFVSGSTLGKCIFFCTL